MTARCVMVLGTHDGAGQGELVTALCRWFARQGLRVAPFQAQAVGGPTRMVPGAGGAPAEIAGAQYGQALAARAQPDVRMNPVWRKPAGGDFVVLGQANARLAALSAAERATLLWPIVRDALDALRARNDVVVIEAGGPPVEFDAREPGVGELRLAQHAQARCLLVADASRGGAFAHLYGTWGLLPPAQRALVHGFVLDRVAGAAARIEAGARHLEGLTGVPTLAALPAPGADDEASQDEVTIAIVAYPGSRELGEFEPLAKLPGVQLRLARSPAELAGAHWLVLPASGSPAIDLHWLRRQGVAAAVVQHANAGGRVLGIAGGMQLLGEALVDPVDIAGNGPGLGLLPLVTQFTPARTLQRTSIRFEPLVGPWAPLSGRSVQGYELHTGETAQHAGMAAGRVAVAGGRGWQNEAGNVLGVGLHGMFEDAGVLQALFAAAPVEDGFERMADAVEQRFVAGSLPGLIAC